MGIIKLEYGEAVRFEDDDYEIAKVVDYDQVIIRNVQTGKTRLAQIDDLSAVDGSDGTIPLGNIKDEHWEVAKHRFEVIEPLLRPDRTKKEVIERGKQYDVSHATVYQWIKLYESTGLLSSLVPHFTGRGGKGKSRLDKTVDKIIDEVINERYLTKQRLAVKYVYKEIEERCKEKGLEPPHVNTVGNRIKLYPAEEKMRKRHGYNKSRYKYTAAPGSFEPLSPLEVIQVDHSPADIFVVDENDPTFVYRPNITVALDVQSRMVYGFYLAEHPPGALSTGQTLAMGALRKDSYLEQVGIDGKWIMYGLPQNTSIATDNAKEFRGKDLARFSEEYGLNITFRPRKTPHFGGHVERFIGTLNNMLHSLPGTTFSSPKDKGDYDPMKEATLTLAEVEKAIVNFIVNIYHEEIHSELGTSPVRKFMTGIRGDDTQPGIGWPDVFEGETAKRLRMAALPSFNRSIQRMGVTFSGIRYFSDSIRHLVNIKSTNLDGYMFKYDPRDLSMVYFYSEEHNEYFPIPCRNLGFPSISIWQLRRVTEMLKSENEAYINEETIASGYRHLQEFRRKELADEKAKSRKGMLKKRVGRSPHDDDEAPLYRRAEEKEDSEQEAVAAERGSRKRAVKVYDVEFGGE